MTMSRVVALSFLLTLAGCSTSPVADLLDNFCSPRLDPAAPTGRGGVCDPVPVITAPPLGALPPAAVAVPPAGAPIVAPGAPPPPDAPVPPPLP